MPTAACQWAKKALNNNYIGHIDAATVSYAVNSTGNIFLLTGPALGGGLTNRIGQNIKNLRLELRGWVYGDTTAKFNYITFDIILDKRPINASLPVTDIFTTADTAGFLKVEEANRFEIIATRTMTLNGAAANEKLDSSARKLDMVFDLKGVKTTYDGDTGLIASINTGAIYICMRGTATTGTTDSEVELDSRLYFQDV